MYSCRDPSKLGSDGKSIRSSLTTSDEEEEEPENLEENDDIAEYALQNPQNIKWRLPARKIVITKKDHPSFGIEYRTKSIRQRDDRPEPRYLLIKEVVSGSPAASTSLRRGDLVLSLNGEPIFREEDSRARRKFQNRMKLIFQEADMNGTLQLHVQSPEEISPNAGTRPKDILVLPHLKNIVRVCPTFTLSKLPYSKIIIVGEESVSLTSRLFTTRRCTSMHTQTFQTVGRLIRRTEQVGRRPVYRLDTTHDSYKTWMWSDESLKQFVDEANGRHPSQQYHYVDVITLSYRQGILSGVVASSCMSGNDVILYQVDAGRLCQEKDDCLQELGSIVSRLHNIVGRSVPVIVAITTKVSYKKEDQESLKRILEQFPQDHCSIVHVVFLESQQETSRSHLPIPVDSTRNHSDEQRGNNGGQTADILAKVIETVWKQKFQEVYPARFLIYLELFWRMVHRKPQRGFLKGEIRNTCQIQDDKELAEFMAFLKMVGEVLIVRPGSLHELIVQPSYVLPFLRKLLTQPSLEEQSSTLRTHWKRLTYLGVVTATFLEEIFGSADMSTVVSALQELNVLLPLSQFAAETNRDIRRISAEKSELFIVKHALGISSDCQCSKREYNNRLRVKFESRIPLDLMERLVLKVVDNSKDKDPRWNVAGRCGCLELIRRDGCAALFQADPLSSSVTILPFLSGNYRPVDLLRLIRKSVLDMEICKGNQPAVGCDCPRCEVEGRVHILDVNPDALESFVHCGVQRLDGDPRVIYWDPRPEHKLVEGRVHIDVNQDALDSFVHCGVQRLDGHPRVIYWDARPEHKLSWKNHRKDSTSRDPDNISNLNDDIYFSLCRRLNVLDQTFRQDWRRLAAKLGFSNEEITQLHKPLCPEWNACDKLLSRWASTGQASVTRLMALLIEINRKDVANDLLRECQKFQPELLDRIDRDKPEEVQRLVDQLS